MQPTCSTKPLCHACKIGGYRCLSRLAADEATRSLAHSAHPVGSLPASTMAWGRLAPSPRPQLRLAERIQRSSNADYYSRYSKAQYEPVPPKAVTEAGRSAAAVKRTVSLLYDVPPFISVRRTCRIKGWRLGARPLLRARHDDIGRP